ncbi:MAG: aminopeptidase [Spirochaetota bacterium]
MKYRNLLPVSLSFLLSSCYSVSIAGQYLCLVAKGKSLAKVESPSAAERELFRRVQRIKRFSEDALGLRATGNYSRYVRLDRDYLTAVISAAPELGFEDYLWNYPFVGKLPYRGYFDIPKAKKVAADLKKQGYDVFVRPVDAFSTLGYVRDPLFSYMVEYSEARLADLIIHESFHATLYVRSDIALNESLANLVGRIGSRLYLEKQGIWEPEEPFQEEERQRFRTMIWELKQQLEFIYQDQSLGREQAIQAKERHIAEWREQFRQPNYRKLFSSDRYEYLADFPINNAYLALFALYEDPEDFLENIYRQFLARHEGDALLALQELINLCKRLAKKHGRKTRAALEEYGQTFAQSSRQGKRVGMMF